MGFCVQLWVRFLLWLLLLLKGVAGLILRRERLAKEGKEQEAACGREDVLLGPDAELYLFFPCLGIAQCHILFLDFFF